MAHAILTKERIQNLRRGHVGEATVTIERGTFETLCDLAEAAVDARVILEKQRTRGGT